MGDKNIKTVEDLEKVLSDPDAVRESLAKVAGEAIRENLTDVVAEQVEAALVRRSRQERIERLPMAGAQYNKHAAGAEVDGKFNSIGDFFLAAHQNKGLTSSNLNIGLKTLNENVGADGGFLVPEEYRAQLMMLALQAGYIRQGAMVLPMPRGNVKFPVLRDTSHASSVFGGVVARWENESGDISQNASQPTFAQVALIAKKLTGYTIASNELLSDSAVGLEALLMRLFPEAIRFYEEESFLNGSGAGQPTGIVNANCTISVSAEAGQTAATVVYENIVNMYARMLPSSVNRAFWLYNPEVFPQLAKLALPVGTGGSAVWISNIQGGPPTTIFGRPAYPSEHCAALGTSGDILFVDPSYYVIGDTQELSVASSMHVNFATDEIVWRFIERLDGRPWLESALSPKYGNNSVSPFIKLATRS